MKAEPSLKKQGSLVLRTMLIILLIIVLAGGFFVFKRMTSQPEPLPQPATVRAKIPSPPPGPKPIKADRQLDQEEAEPAAADDGFYAEIAENTPETTDSAESKAQPENNPAESTESANVQGATADQTLSISAEATEKTAPPPAETDTSESQEPEAKLAVKGDPVPVKTSPRREETEGNDPGEIARDKPSSPIESPVRTGLAIQTASFRTKAYAEKRVNELKQKGYDAFIYEAFDKSQNPWYMVRFGHFENRSEADGFLVRFNEEENAAAIVVIQK